MKIQKTIMLMLAAVIPFLLSCNAEDSEESRIYVTDSTPLDSYSITALYVVESPNGYSGDWGSNILDGNTDGPFGWQQYTFDPGEYDYRIEYYDGANKYIEKLGMSASDKHGLKFDMDGSNLFTTYFTFE
ncbi:MAG TPA: hypothetical protein PK624_08635 [Spirochaetota bacterium]|mgnify:FL=1|nr:hypothetical protein [Spirochaetota bacterium]HOF34030.1 hypothetical protein [Spirochaetota bacterium]HOR44846.1 hypothetical protein [Spirochaetota bacterium]HPK55504.1 hypothetical protein [Spirochaetota bacterium]HQE60397.1 hypothetical protein [Spirochaetota bacterium]